MPHPSATYLPNEKYAAVKKLFFPVFCHDGLSLLPVRDVGSFSKLLLTVHVGHNSSPLWTCGPLQHSKICWILHHICCCYQSEAESCSEKLYYRTVLFVNSCKQMLQHVWKIVFLPVVVAGVPAFNGMYLWYAAVKGIYRTDFTFSKIPEVPGIEPSSHKHCFE